MATLYVENVPDELYEALRSRAKQNRKSIAVEVISLLQENVPTPQELKRRQRLFQRVLKLRSGKPAAQDGLFLTTDEMQREDRAR